MKRFALAIVLIAAVGVGVFLALNRPGAEASPDATITVNDTGSLTGETNEWATAEPGEPNHDGLAGTPAHSVWYQWTPSVDAAASFEMTTPVSPDDWDSVLAVYTGTEVDALTEVAANRTVGTYLPLDFSVTGGTTYQLAVDGQAADQMGTFDLNWSIWPDSGFFTVTKTADSFDGVCDADCSLREAVHAANTGPGDDTIDLPAGTYELTIDTYLLADDYGSLDIEAEQGTTTIIGAGRDVTTIDASTLRTEGLLGNPDRVFSVGYHAGLELVGVTVTGGYTENTLSADRDGGGIWNWNGYLTVTDCLIEGNVAGENGGGIANSYGTATITNTIIRSNNTDPPDYHTFGLGGGVYSSGTMTIVDSIIELNASDDGGGVYNENYLGDTAGTLAIENSLITNNTAGRGGGLANVSQGTAAVTDSLITGNHATRSWEEFNALNRGGGILNWAADLTVIRSTISGNEARATHASAPASGGGGGIANDLGDLTVIDTTVSANEAICDQRLYGDSDLCGRGGGILNAGGYASVVNSTISGNTTALLNSDHSPYLGGGGGGGLAHMPRYIPGWHFCPVTIVDSVTITDNTAAHGGGVNTRWETLFSELRYYVEEWRVGTNANGHPILECPDMYVGNTIIAGNTATFTAGTEDSWGDYTSNGHNLVGDGTGCPADGIGDVTTADPLLGPLADNGGPTQTHALLAGSPATDTGSGDCPPPDTDQRGVARPVDGDGDGSAICDIGAFEYCGDPGIDTDGDGFDDDVECYIGTDSLDDCPDDLGSPGLCPGPSCDGDDCWPPDLDVDREADIADVLKFKPIFLIGFPCIGEPGYDSRFDFNANGCINIADVLLYKPIILTQCTNPPTLSVHFIDVGQGDAILIESSDVTILVDGGGASANVENYLQAQAVDDIDLMVATHPHADHIGGLIDVLALYDVHEIWTNGETHTSQTYEDFAAAVAAESATERDVSRGYSTQMNGLEIDVLHPTSPLSGDLNEDSVVLQVSCGEVAILLTGDATTDSEASMQAAGVLSDVEVLKVGHHGSNTSTGDAFLTAVTPEDAVISVGAGNPYGHPHQDTLDRLSAAGVTVYRTDLDGTVVLTSDCATYSLEAAGS